jgi:hypothetical protein
MQGFKGKDGGGWRMREIDFSTTFADHHNLDRNLSACQGLDAAKPFGSE